MSLRSRSETTHVIISAAAGTTAVVAAVTGQRVGIYKMIVTVASTATLAIQDTAGGALSQTFGFGTSGGSITIDIPINNESWFQSGLNLGIQFVVTGATVSADVWYLQGP
jgi:hypothetical protein